MGEKEKEEVEGEDEVIRNRRLARARRSRS